MKGFRRLIVLSLLALSTLLLGQTQPSVPPTISYQGRITDAAFPIAAEGEYEMTFLLFDAATGGNLLWSETQPGVAVMGGRYQVSLGAVEPIEFSTLNQRNAYLEARIFGETVGPRRRIVSAPFALKAEGEVPAGGVILAAGSGDAGITDLGYTRKAIRLGRITCIRKAHIIPLAPGSRNGSPGREESFRLMAGPWEVRPI